MRGLITPTGYSRAEYLSDVVVHVTGFLAVCACVPILITLAVYDGHGAAPITAASLYGTVFALMIAFSGLYNIFPHPKWEWLLKRLDHAAIYLKIAGTITALALIHGGGAVLITGVWMVAIPGILLKLASPYRFKTLGLLLYVGLGLFGGLAADQMFQTLPHASLTFLTAGGSLYLVGVVFYLWASLPYNMAIWHLIVLFASLLTYSSVLVAVMGA